MSEYCSLPLMQVFSQRPDRLKTIDDAMRHIPPLTQDDTFLEVACGDGRAACRVWESQGCRVTGVDISEERIHMARETSASIGAGDMVNFVCCDFLAANLPETYSLLYCENFFSSLRDKEKHTFADKAAKLVKPGGYVILYDFTAGNNGSEDEKTQIETIPCFVGIKKPETYCGYFKSAGFDKISITDTSLRIYAMGAYLARTYGCAPSQLGEALARAENAEKGLREPSPEEMASEQLRIKNFLKDDKIGSAMIIMRKQQNY